MRTLKIILLTLVLTILFCLPSLAQKKIAVLPFSVPDNHPEMEQFGIGTADSITIALSNVPEFVMVDRNQMQNILKEIAFQQSGFVDEQNAVKAGKLLGAEMLILGTIQYDNNKYRVSARLTEVETGKIVKALQVTGGSIFELQDQIASAVAAENQISLTQIMKDRISSVLKATDNTIAYDYYVKGKTQALRHNEDGYKKAVYWFNKAIENDPDYVLAMASKAEIIALYAFELEINGLPYMDLLETAETTAQKAILKNTNLIESHRALSTVYKIRGKFSESSQEAKKALEINKNDPEAYYLLWANNGKDINDPLLKRALEINPFIIKKHLAIGYAFYKQGKYHDAINIFNQTVSLNPEISQTYIGLGLSYYKLGKNETAFKYFLEAEKLDPKAPDVYTGLGVVHLELGNTDKSIASFKKSMSLNSKYSYAYSGLGYVYMVTGEREKALPLYKKAIQLNPDDFFALNGMGYYHYEKNNLEEALKYYMEVIKKNPSDPDVYYNLALLYRKKGMHLDSEANFKKAITLSPVFARYYLQLADLYTEQGKNNESIALLEQGLKHQPEDAKLNSRIAILYHKNGKLKQAEEYYYKTLKYDPKDINVHNNLGTIYFSQGNFKNAIAKFQEALKINPDDINANDNLGLSYHKEGNYTEAIKYYRKSCNLGKKDTCDWLKSNNF